MHSVIARHVIVTHVGESVMDTHGVDVDELVVMVSSKITGALQCQCIFKATKISVGLNFFHYEEWLFKDRDKSTPLFSV